VAKAADVGASDGAAAGHGFTSAGIALGRPAYTSPEQAGADPNVDYRADIYSFGCVAYEMLCGESPFTGRLVQEMVAAHITQIPVSITSRRANVPEPLASPVMRCLEKRPDDRPQAATEVLAALDGVATPPDGTTASREGRRRRVRWIAGSAVMAAAAIGGVLLPRSRANGPFIIRETKVIASSPELQIDPSISPDGKLVAYAAGPIGAMRIYVRQLDASGPPVAVSRALAGVRAGR
jgi:serine/threonine-protein kinase